MKQNFTLLLFITISLVLATNASATITRTDLHINITIKPNEIFEFSLLSKGEVRIGYELIGECENPCVELSHKHETNNFNVATNGGLTQDFSPNKSSSIDISFKNISDENQVVTIFKELRICDSEACSLLKNKGIIDLHNFDVVDWTFKRIVSKRIDSYKTSQDNSYTVVKGESIHNTKYEVVLLWWLYQEEPYFSSCLKWISQYGNYNPPGPAKPKPVKGRGSDLFKSNSGNGLISNWTPKTTKQNKDATKPYQFSGSYMTKPVAGIMQQIGCSRMDIKPKDHNDL